MKLSNTTSRLLISLWIQDKVTSRMDVSGERKNLERKVVQGTLLVVAGASSSPWLVLGSQALIIFSLFNVLPTCRPRSWSSGSWRWAPPGPRCTSWSPPATIYIFVGFQLKSSRLVQIKWKLLGLKFAREGKKRRERHSGGCHESFFFMFSTCFGR